jgi:hypothetical protein
MWALGRAGVLQQVVHPGEAGGPAGVSGDQAGKIFWFSREAFVERFFSNEFRFLTVANRPSFG